jgi:hypothetical protein
LSAIQKASPEEREMVMPLLLAKFRRAKPWTKAKYLPQLMETINAAPNHQ